MSDQVEMVYTVTRAPATADRLGTQVSLLLELDQDDPPVPYVDGSTQFSRLGLRKATTVHGRWYRGSMRAPWITPITRPFVREFLESTAEEEPFNIVHAGYLGWDSDVGNLRVYRPLNTGSLTRLDVTDDYALSFQWRQIEQ